jgi:hypothetical protein
MKTASARISSSKMPPEGTRQLQVKMAAKGLKVKQGSGNELLFYSEASDDKVRNELVYRDLKCWDANKQPLNATLAYADNRIQISVMSPVQPTRSPSTRSSPMAHPRMPNKVSKSTKAICGWASLYQVQGMSTAMGIAT